MKKRYFYTREDYVKVQAKAQKNNKADRLIMPTLIEEFVVLFDPGPPHIDQKYIEVRKIFHEYEKGKVLDIGCGRGEWEGWFRKATSDPKIKVGKCTGIDINKDLVKWAKTKGRNCMVMDMEDLQFENNTFDMVIFRGMEHCNNPRKAALDAKRVCVSGGLIVAKTVIGERDNKSHLWTMEEGNSAGLLTPSQIFYSQVFNRERRGCREEVIIGWNAKPGASTHRFIK